MAKDLQTVKMRTVKNNTNPTGIKELSIEKLNRTPLSDYYRMADKFVNVENYVYEATAVYENAVINTDHIAELFTSGANQPGVIVNTGAAIPRQGEHLTNMVTDGEFDNGTSFLLEMISVDVFLTADEPAAILNGAIINPQIQANAGYSLANHYKAISRQFKLEFIRGEKQVMVEGKLYQFPSPFVASGAIGASVGGFIQNGFSIPTWNKLSEIHALKSNDRFAILIKPLVNGFLPSVPFEIRVQFIGKRIQTLYA